MKALILQTIGNLSLTEAEKPVARPEELLVRIEAGGICGIADARRLSRLSWRKVRCSAAPPAGDPQAHEAHDQHRPG